jgi:uncharacterized phage-associated protein
MEHHHMQEKQTRPITFYYNREKAVQAALWLLNRHGGQMDRLKLVKLLFFADRDHLARYGRPVIGGHYRAMKYGPVCSEFLDDINIKIETPAQITCIESKDHKLFAKAMANEDVLSESDIEILEQIDKQYGKHDPFVLAEITHRLKAWDVNYPNKDANTSNPLPYEDFFLDLQGDSILELIRDDQEAWDALAS